MSKAFTLITAVPGCLFLWLSFFEKKRVGWNKTGFRDVI